MGAAAAVALGAAFWDDVFGSAGSAPSSPRGGYGPRGAENQHGLRLPEGFRSRLIARGGRPVEGTGYRWHEASDGMACFPADDGGWILVSNSEVLEGGASAVHFGADARPRGAYRILDGTTQNCSGGGTPWGTWMSCEEVQGGLVWECDPAGKRRALSRPAMGTFKHEAAAVDPNGRTIYLTEDLMDGGVYRFTPTRWRDLSEGLLEIATVASDGAVTWTRLPDPAARRAPTRQQVRGSTEFKRAEGIWHDDGVIYIATTGDHRVHAYDIAGGRLEVIYDGLASREAPLLRVDQLTANQRRRGVRLRGHRDRGDRHRGDRPPGARVEVPLGHRPRPRGLRAHGRDVRPLRQPHVLLVAARLRKGRHARSGRDLRGLGPVSRFTGLSRDGTQRVTTLHLQGFSVQSHDATAARAGRLHGRHARRPARSVRPGGHAGAAKGERPSGVVKLRLLGVNDFHGHLEPPRPGVGGAAWLKAHLDRATLPGRTIRVHAGDMVGATPLISSWFHDEPTVEAANEMGFDVGTLGNHEFDEGGDELMRLLGGGRRGGPAALKRGRERRGS